MNDKVYKYFPAWELQCPHCHELGMNPTFMAKLITARERAGIPFSLTSAYRCPDYNRSDAVGGTEGSSHTIGRGVDIKCIGNRQRWTVLNALLSVGFNRIGIYEKHIHVDDDPTKDPDVVWYGEYDAAEETDVQTRG